MRTPSPWDSIPEKIALNAFKHVKSDLEFESEMWKRILKH